MDISLCINECLLTENIHFIWFTSA